MKKISALLLFFWMSYATSATMGICVHPDSMKTNPSNIISLVTKFNFKSIRMDYRWSDVETHYGNYRFEGVTEDILQLALRNNITPLIILGGSNHLYGKGRPWDDKTQLAFAKYAENIAQHYSNKKVIFEIWNEWSLKHNYDPKLSDFKNLDSATAYYNLVRIVSPKIRKYGGKNFIIVAGGFNPTDKNDQNWGSQLIKMGIMKYIDGISVHPYTDLNPEDSFIIMDRMQASFTANNNGNVVPLFITEYGIPNRIGTKYTQRYTYTLAKRFINEASKSSYIQGIWWYDLVDDGNQISNSEHQYGILTQDLKQKEISQLFLK